MLIRCDRALAWTVWGEDVLLNNPDLECGFPAVTCSYSWVLAFDGRTLNTAIRMFPLSMAKLEWVRRRWSVRRCVVLEAERRCFNSQPRIHFRGRMYPLYDKKTAKAMKAERQAREAEREELALRTKEPTSDAKGWSSPLPADQRRAARSLTRTPMGRRGGPPADLKSKLALKHARAATMAAASEYGMQMRVHQMLVSSGQDPPPQQSRHTPRHPIGPAGEAPAARGVGGAAVHAAAASQAAVEQLSEHLESSVKASVASLLPSISAAVATEVARKIAADRRARRFPPRTVTPWNSRRAGRANSLCARAPPYSLDKRW